VSLAGREWRKKIDLHFADFNAWLFGRHMDWQRETLLPLQEMFGQVGMGRFWDATPCFPAAAHCSTSRDTRRSFDRRSFEQRRSLDIRRNPAKQQQMQEFLGFRRTKSRSL